MNACDPTVPLTARSGLTAQSLLSCTCPRACGRQDGLIPAIRCVADKVLTGLPGWGWPSFIPFFTRVVGTRAGEALRGEVTPVPALLTPKGTDEGGSGGGPSAAL